ncbi:MAG: CehA/McbA family metallohydrolase [Thermodesulfobacteriota bacterium]
MLAPASAWPAAYFGDLHAHSALSDDATNPPDAFFRVARDVAGLDFVVLSDHDAFLDDNEWEILKTTAASFHVPGRFVTFSAVEWTHRWHMNVYFQRDDERYCGSRECPEAADLYAFYGPRVAGGVAAAHVNHQADLFKVNREEIDDRITNAVEVWNTGGAGDNEAGFGNALWALRAGFRLGLVGVSDDHHSERDPPLLGTGLTGCPADALTREDLLAALRARRCWATGGERIELALDVAGSPMGSELEAHLGSRLEVTATVLATRAPVVVELVRNGDVVERVRCSTTSCRATGRVAVAEPETFVYARVAQAGGARAWSSPVWVRGTCPGGTDCLAARLAPGGGERADDCITEWLLPASAAHARARNVVRCTDGDRTCDLGRETGECVLRVGLCFGVRDRRLPECTPTAPEELDVLLPAASSDRATREFQSRATLVAAHHASSGRDGLDRCSPPNEIRVPLGTTRLEIESRAGARVDRDALDVDCRPARRERRLPRVGAAHALDHEGANR